jgi:hypothetical protein
MGCPTMKSKLLQKKSYGVNQSHEVVDGQQENIEDSSSPWRGHETPSIPSTRSLTLRPAKTLLDC